MSKEPFGLFRRTYLVVFLLIAVLGVLIIGVTYVASTSFYAASTQLLNKDVAAHIAKFTSPYGGREGFDRVKADSVFYQAMVISPSAEVYFLDTTGRVIYFHGDTAAILNWQVDVEALQKYLGSGGLNYVSGSDPRDPGHRKVFSAASVDGPDGRLGFIYVIFGNQQYRSVTHMLVNSRVAPAVLGAVVCIVFISLVVTVSYMRRFRRRVELMSKISRVEASEKERRDFMTNMAHDLRTPLAIARGYAETLQLKRGELSEDEAQEFGDLVLSKIKQVEKMVGQVFDLSKMESASFELRREPFVFSEVLQEVVRGKEGIDCVNCRDGAWVNGDIALMERVLQNLVVNAVAYTAAGGGVWVGLERVGGELRVMIRNAGVMPGDIAAWFNGGELARPGKPVIGLSIVKRVLAMHGFAFGVEVGRGETAVGEGMTEVWFRMPVVG